MYLLWDPLPSKPSSLAYHCSFIPCGDFLFFRFRFRSPCQRLPLAVYIYNPACWPRLSIRAHPGVFGLGLRTYCIGWGGFCWGGVCFFFFFFGLVLFFGFKFSFVYLFGGLMVFLCKGKGYVFGMYVKRLYICRGVLVGQERGGGGSWSNYVLTCAGFDGVCSAGGVQFGSSVGNLL